MIPLLNTKAVAADICTLNSDEQAVYLRLMLINADKGRISETALKRELHGNNSEIQNILRLLKKDLNGYYFEWLEPKPITHNFTSLAYQSWWAVLCEQKNWKKKSIHALQLSANYIYKFSNGSEAEAIELIKRTIANNYQGVHQLTKTKQDVITTKQHERINSLKDLLTGKAGADY